MENTSEILIFQTEKGNTDIQVKLENETVWLTLNQMSELFSRDKSVISRHISNIYKEGELEKEGTVAKNAMVQSEGGREVTREITSYNLDVIISVGYRIKSQVGTQFRIWATKRIKEYIIKGFTMDDTRLKKEKSDYFDELLERVRDIRTSEKVFYQKIIDIYTTSTDYTPKSGVSRLFFATIQNKFHFATHGHTAAELIMQRADSDKPYMGLTSWSGDKPRKKDVTIAKNYLTADELRKLNLLVDQYLAFAELQAEERAPMKMVDWIEKLHGFLTLNNKEILADAGRVSKQMAKELAESEYAKYKNARIEDTSSHTTLNEMEQRIQQLKGRGKI